DEQAADGPLGRVRSMTGYGAGRADAPSARVTVEVRGVNQRFLDLRIVAPREYAAWEREMRARASAMAQRGRVEVTVARAAAAALRRATAAIRRRLPHALAALRNQVEERLVRLVGGAELDRGRVAQEVAMLAERSDVTEEVVRLEGHLGALARALGERGPVGKRIEFLLQEIQRELNTTGAKAGDREITDLVLGAKAEVEKLREQVQNVE